MISELLLPAAIITALAGAAAAMMLEKREERCLDVSFGAAAVVSLLILAVGLDVLLGSDLEAIDQAEERSRFAALLDRLSLVPEFLPLRGYFLHCSSARYAAFHGFDRLGF